MSIFLHKKNEEHGDINIWTGDLLTRLESFAQNGKMLRGGMIVVAHDLLHGTNKEAALMSAVAMELIHSAFLIHDDIMDRDQLRRGSETIYYQYQKMGESRQFEDSYSFGQAMGICAGDEAFFFAYELLSQLPVDSSVIRKILSRVTLEMKRVGLAQMQDVAFGYSTDNPSLDEILNVYRFKTAYYTFSLPLHIAAVLTGQSEKEIRKLENIGEALGIIFQLKDDDIGLFESEETIGKPSGSDIREDKKTVFRYYIKNAGSGHEQQQIDRLFGKASLNAEEIQWIRDVSIQRGVRNQVMKMVSEYEHTVRRDVQSLQEAENLRPMLLALLDYSLERTF
jgi:geranylgeranyl diphosphate synthase type I